MNTAKRRACEQLYKVSKYALIMFLCLGVELLDHESILMFGALLFRTYNELFHRGNYATKLEPEARVGIMTPTLVVLLGLLFGFEGILNDDPTSLLHFSMLSFCVFVALLSFQSLYVIGALVPPILALSMRRAVLAKSGDEPGAQLAARQQPRTRVEHSPPRPGQTPV